MPSIIYRLRGVESWQSATATVTSSEVLSEGGRNGRTMNIFFSYPTSQGSLESGKLFVDDNSSLYGLSTGETFDLRVNPKRTSQFYCEEASSLSRTIRRTIICVGVTFAAAVILVQYFGR